MIIYLKNSTNLVFIIKIENNFIFLQGSGLTTRSMSSLPNDTSNNDSRLLNNTAITNNDVEFGGSFGNLMLALFLPILVILSKIALKNVMNNIYFCF